MSDATKKSVGAGEAVRRLAPYLALRTPLSRRQAEAAIVAGRVQVDGVPWVDFYAPTSGRICVDGQEVDPPAPVPQLWMYHKPPGEIVSRCDPQGRPTVFDALAGLLGGPSVTASRATASPATTASTATAQVSAQPLGAHNAGKRLVCVGRLDFDSQGLLLATNTPELAHFLETSRLLRTYRVWVTGVPRPATLARLARGLCVDGVQYRPCRAWIDNDSKDVTARRRGGPADQAGVGSHLRPGGQGWGPWAAGRARWGNKKGCWVTLVLDEGKKREVRVLMAALGHPVQQLIRLSFGPYHLADLPMGHVAPLKIPNQWSPGQQDQKGRVL